MNGWIALIFYVCSGSGVACQITCKNYLEKERAESVFNLIVAEWGKGHSELAGDLRTLL